MEELRKPLLEVLPDELSCKINSYLESDQNSQTSLVLTSKRFYSLFQPERLSTKLLLNVARGEQDKAEKFLPAHPNLLFQKSKVTDYSSRTFKHISPLQYAAWGLDTHMLKMMLKYVPNEEKLNAHEQLEELDNQGTDHGSHYDFSPLITALQTYIDNYNAWNDVQRADHWRKQVGGAQRMVPVHVANEYCHPNRSFYATPRFKENTLKRSLEFYDHLNDRSCSWFPLSPPESGMGSDFAIGRGLNFSIFSATAGVAAAWPFGNEPRVSSRDLAAVTALSKVRSAELVVLKQQLLISSQEMKVESPKTKRCVIQ